MWALGLDIHFGTRSSFFLSDRNKGCVVVILYCHVCRSHSHLLIVCSVTTNNIPCIEKWGVQSNPPHRWALKRVCLNPPTERRKCLKVTHSGLFLFECTHRKPLCLSVTHRQLFWFQGYPQKVLKITELPADRCFCFNVAHKKLFCF